MDKKSKLIVIILAVLTVISGLFAFQINNAKQTAERRYTREIKELLGRNEQLLQKVAKSEQDRKKIQDALNSLSREVDGIESEREEWKKKYGLISQEKDQLLTKISELSEELTKKPKAAEVKAVDAEKPIMGEEEAYWTSIIKEKAGLELKLNNLSQKLTTIKLEFEGVKKEKHELELAVSKLEQLKDDLKRQVEYNEKLANNLSNDLAREVNDKQFLLDQFNKIKGENVSLRTQIKELAMTKLSLEKTLTKIQDEKSVLDKRIFETERILQDRIDDILDLKGNLEDVRLGKLNILDAKAKSVELPPIVVRSQEGATKIDIIEGLGGKTGRVVSINKENNFVIIDLGENSGIQIKDRFKVYRDSKQIATVEVIQLRKDISAADIIKEYGAIQVGDSVK